jgi:hypothetical protein
MGFAHFLKVVVNFVVAAGLTVRPHLVTRLPLKASSKDINLELLQKLQNRIIACLNHKRITVTFPKNKRTFTTNLAEFCLEKKVSEKYL